MGDSKGGDGGAAQSAAEFKRDQSAQQLRWQSEQAQSNQANQANYYIEAQKAMKDKATFDQQQQQADQQNIDQAKARAEAGSLSGVKAANTVIQNTVDPQSLKLTTAGLPGLDLLSNTLKKRSSFNSNSSGGSSNMPQASQTATLGGG